MAPMIQFSAPSAIGVCTDLVINAEQSLGSKPLTFDWQSAYHATSSRATFTMSEELLEPVIDSGATEIVIILVVSNEFGSSREEITVSIVNDPLPKIIALSTHQTAANSDDLLLSVDGMQNPCAAAATGWLAFQWRLVTLPIC